MQGSMKTCIPEDQAVVQGWIECWMKTKIESKETYITEGIKKNQGERGKNQTINKKLQEQNWRGKGYGN